MVHSSLSPFYSLSESMQYEHNPDVQIVYMTEKGIDLFAAFPDIRATDLALRRGYTWDNLPQNYGSSVLGPQKHICIVKTTEAELAVHKQTRPAAEDIDHANEMVKSIDAVPESERTIERIADFIVEYMVKNELTDLDMANQVCEIIGRRTKDHTTELLARIDAIPECERTTECLADNVVDYLQTNHISDFTLADEMCEMIVSRGMLKQPTYQDSASYDEEDTWALPENESPEVLSDSNVSIGSSISAWLITSFDSVCSSIEHVALEILPIPTDMKWIALD